MLKKIAMPSFSPKSARSYGVRSVSFPARSHPNICRIQEELNKLNSWNESSSINAGRIRAALTALKEIYKCIEDLLNLPLTQQALAQHHEKKWVVDMLDDLVRYLDVCGNARDAMMLMKETVRELQSALRRSKAVGGELSIGSNINAYFCSRKKVIKEAGKFLTSLKHKEDRNNIFFSLLNADDRYVSAVVKSLREANWVSISIFSSVLLFLSSPIMKPKTSKWSLLSRMMHKGVAAAACESQEEHKTELEHVDAALTNLLVPNNSSSELEEDEKTQSAQKMLEVLDISIEELENELECLFRHLIHSRVSFLNMVSHQLEWF